ncbi:hypothetical protein KRE40_00165 [Elizabethkingia meningoseptica]|uniref:hypothetical protein n=1 Tax=Elizabethkingia meningoseptica TaxID=238 RepID=UPI0023AF5E20|nr:hypothetical protein [Elizabethkingia meningoseptica]MDE5437905.1 hypothetical protein [Elizabethkingia meningoseptica]MDE5507062.1 hypothetical protein [Elizabethkingia meningoseptica]MDE5515655.1 hypothetical protein [Elizabethkingia meningoseptica]MDE5529922.1 hypothetical protein [Elizabethkingia meningoseptica]MDE5533478.1 hypothetical protein [Elizabethkingia meningoseptica]
MNEYLDAEFDRADELIGQDLNEEAKAVLNNILLEDPKYGKAHNHLGWLLKNKENDAIEAEKHYKLAMDFTPEYGASYLNYAYLLSETKRYDELKDILTRAEAVEDVNKSNLSREWAYYYEDTRQYEKAIDRYKEYALSLYDNTYLEKAKEGIERCKMKMEILKM